MGRAKRVIPKKMPVKLKIIREYSGLNLEQMVTALEQMLDNLGYKEIRLYSGNVYEFEKGVREPMLPVLLAYARIGEAIIDELVDDLNSTIFEKYL